MRADSPAKACGLRGCSANIAAALLCTVAALTVTGCATIVRGSLQSVIVNTSPPGAACIFNRDGRIIATAEPTPKTVDIEKGRKDIVVTCSRRGYKEASAPLLSTFEGWTFGNILFGGLIGVAVDAGSGAMHDYPQSIRITLIPEQFSSIAARDVFFDGLLEELESESAAALKRLLKTCQGKDQCDKYASETQSLKQRRITELELERSRAAIAGQQ